MFFTEDAKLSRESFPDAIGAGCHWGSFTTSEQALCGASRHHE
jgi:hypothetical protein